MQGTLIACCVVVNHPATIGHREKSNRMFTQMGRNARCDPEMWVRMHVLTKLEHQDSNGKMKAAVKSSSHVCSFMPHGMSQAEGRLKPVTQNRCMSGVKC